ncbi:unnamed protein product [Protopolystoma xenopodis]|uniref:Uncharacterized protein n=1 Tax=Protopolystoma xenopodis TaxID=117903 RepID=A0A3S5AIV6_9PLAT|nr:unnamed protein product [Protopolystoma xenopodis]
MNTFFIQAERDPILQTGDLGEELDLLRPHGGRPRNKYALVRKFLEYWRF